MLVQKGTIIILFECKLDISYHGESIQLNNYRDILNQNKSVLVKSSYIQPFNKIIRIYAIKEQNYLLNIDSNFVTDIYTTFMNDPRIILEQKY